MFCKNFFDEECWWVFEIDGEHDNDNSKGCNSATDGKGIVTAFIERLHGHPESKTRIIEQFECWFFSNRKNIKLTQESRYHLLIGNDKNGLLFNASGMDATLLSAMATLRLLRKLLSPEYCPDAHQFLDIISRLDKTSRLHVMEFVKFFAYDSRDIRFNGFFLLEILIRLDPQLNASSILADSNTLMEYEKWRELRRRNRMSRHLVPRQRLGTSTAYPTAKPTDIKSGLRSERPMYLDRYQMVLDEAAWQESSSSESHVMTSEGLKSFDQIARHNYDLQSAVTLVQKRDCNRTVYSSPIQLDPSLCNDVDRFVTLSPTDKQDFESEGFLSDGGGQSTASTTDDEPLCTSIPTSPAVNSLLKVHCGVVVKSSSSPSLIPTRLSTEWKWVRVHPVFKISDFHIRYRCNIPHVYNQSIVEASPSPSPLNDILTKLNKQMDGLVCAQDAVGWLSVGGREIEARLSPSVVVELELIASYPAALIAAIMFDFRETIAEALANPLASNLLEMADVEALVNFQRSHWTTNIIKCETEVRYPTKRVQNYEFEASCPPRSLIAVKGDLNLTFELDREAADGQQQETYVIFGRIQRCNSLSEDDVGEPSKWKDYNNSCHRSSYTAEVPPSLKRKERHLMRPVPLRSLMGILRPSVSTSSLPNTEKSTSFNEQNDSKEFHNAKIAVVNCELGDSASDCPDSRCRKSIGDFEYRIKSLHPHSCRLLTTFYFPQELVGLVSSDLLGESHVICKSTRNILYLAKTLAPFFNQSSLPSVLTAAQKNLLRVLPEFSR